MKPSISRMSGFVSGSGPVRLRVRVWFATGLVSVFVSGSCPGSGPVRVWLVSGFVSGACQVSVCVRS